MSTNDDWKEEAGPPLAELLERARRASEEAPMSDADAARVWSGVRHGRPPRRWPLGWVATAAAVLLAGAGLAWLERPAPIEVVKEIRFESVHDGKTVRFEMTVYRETRKENIDGKPPL